MIERLNNLDPLRDGQPWTMVDSYSWDEDEGNGIDYVYRVVRTLATVNHDGLTWIVFHQEAEDETGDWFFRGYWGEWTFKGYHSVNDEWSHHSREG